MRKIDLVPNRADYYTQLNNEQDPKIACQATTAAQCISVVDDVSILTMLGPYKQPEDNLRRFCKHDQETMGFCIKSHGANWAASVDHPSEWADVLVFAINKIMGYQCARFDPNLTINKIRQDLEKGLPIQVSLRFPRITGHYVSIIGQYENGDLIINDPYRDWLHDGPDGYHVRYTEADWITHNKGYGIRYAKR